MNARYYLKPNGTEHIDISEFQAHRPTLRSDTGSTADNLQSQMNMFKDIHEDVRQVSSVVCITGDGV